MFRFMNPEYLYAIAVLPVLYIIVRIQVSRRAKKLKQELGENLSDFLTSSYSAKRRLWKFRFELFALMFLLIAMARPQMGQGEQKVKSTGIELMLAVDVSKSMLSEDVKPSRLQFLKREMGVLLDRLAGDKVGLVVFAGSSALVSPLTNDYSALKMFIDGLTPESVSSQGTNFTKAIDESVKAFERGGIESDESIRVSRVLLINSDGEDNEEGALKAAEEAKKKGVSIFSLGFGTAKGGSIPIRDERGYLKGYKQDQNGNIIVSQAKTKLLQDIAQKGGGNYYHSVIGGYHIEALLKDFNQLEKAEFESSVAKNYNEYFQYPLFLAFLCLFLERAIASRRSKTGKWKGRFTEGASA
ncbi:MAG: VWA domain-containing protein [Bdellovibrionota bacterium]|nr:VWA domain-containing protein [Bdellovibrionota bacterium]